MKCEQDSANIASFMPLKYVIIQSAFTPDVEPFPVMPPSDNLFVIEEDQEGEDLLTIEEFSKDMGSE